MERKKHRTHDAKATRKRILQNCIPLFLEKGYDYTTPKEIVQASDVSNSSFYYAFKSKSGVLAELCEVMFENQFKFATELVGEKASGAVLYAAETSVQLALAEHNENIRQIYVKVYTDPTLLELVRGKTAAALPKFFATYLPDADERFFYEMEIATSSIMRGYMALPCDEELTLERKIELFIRLALGIYKVPEDEINKAVDTVLSKDIDKFAEKVMNELFAQLEVTFDFKLSKDK